MRISVRRTNRAGFLRAERWLIAIVLYDNRVVCFKSEGDVTIYVVGSAEENEILLFNAILALRDSLTILLKSSVDKVVVSLLSWQ